MKLVDKILWYRELAKKWPEILHINWDVRRVQVVYRYKSLHVNLPGSNAHVATTVLSDWYLGYISCVNWSLGTYEQQDQAATLLQHSIYQAHRVIDKKELQ